ncbi:Gfo/Idh/MocA family protein [Bacillus sp. 03113]|uniref:Gfo/Idh/MocA family protein n=1 Tax=Bacillus sp. 03113 TaxID=2578211 RepID=UPI001144EC56|nr:Gfo/Idh/MocA family oxidoreductase [Bacillus sp. 03113]
MQENKIGVGIIGASMDGTWGGLAHLPALQALSNFKVAAISTTRKESAYETAKRFGIPKACIDPYELASNPHVDLVTITVKVPEHDKLVRTALEAGKHVYCEFPLGRTTEEATNLLQIAEEKGLRHFVGLQARTNPAFKYAKDLIASGYVGEVLAVHCNYSLPLFSTRSKKIKRSRTYLLDKANGANQLTITAGHLLDGITYMFGPFSEISAITETQIKQVKVEETGEIIQATSPDHVLVNGILASGAIMSTQIRNTHIGNLSLEINGTEGDLILQSKDNFMFQIDSFLVKVAQGNSKDFDTLPIPPEYNQLPSMLKAGPAFNIAQLYSHIFRDLRENTYHSPDFHTAIKTHKLLEKIQKAAKTGIKQKINI